MTDGPATHSDSSNSLPCLAVKISLARVKGGTARASRRPDRPPA